MWINGAISLILLYYQTTKTLLTYIKKVKYIGENKQ